MENESQHRDGRVAIDIKAAANKRTGRTSIPRGAVGGPGSRRANRVEWTCSRDGRELGPGISLHLCGGLHLVLSCVGVRVQHDGLSAFQNEIIECHKHKLKIVSRFLALCVRRLDLAQVFVRRTDSPLRASFASTACRRPSRPGPGEKGSWMLGEYGDRMRTLDSAHGNDLKSGVR